jgi:hypothetical protein
LTGEQLSICDLPANSASVYRSIGNSGDIFDANIMARMADLKIDLSLDIYPRRQV